MQGDDHLAQVGLVRRGGQLHHPVPQPQRGRDGVGELEQAAAGALVDREVEALRRPAVRLGEMCREAVEVRHRRTPPAVDRLARVTDRRDRVPAAEQADEHPPLRDAGVLVFVEQHHPGARPLGDADLGHLLGEAGRERHLVAEVDGVEIHLGGPVGAHQRRQLDAFSGHQGHLAQLVAVPLGAFAPAASLPVVGGAGLLDEGTPLGVPGLESVRIDEVLRQLGLQADQVAHQHRQRAGQVPDRPAVAAQHPSCELVAGGVGEQA